MKDQKRLFNKFSFACLYLFPHFAHHLNDLAVRLIFCSQAADEV